MVGFRLTQKKSKLISIFYLPYIFYLLPINPFNISAIFYIRLSIFYILSVFHIFIFYISIFVIQEFHPTIYVLYQSIYQYLNLSYYLSQGWKKPGVFREKKQPTRFFCFFFRVFWSFFGGFFSGFYGFFGGIFDF